MEVAFELEEGRNTPKLLTVKAVSDSSAGVDLEGVRETQIASVTFADPEGGPKRPAGTGTGAAGPVTSNPNKATGITEERAGGGAASAPSAQPQTRPRPTLPFLVDIKSRGAVKLPFLEEVRKRGVGKW